MVVRLIRQLRELNRQRDGAVAVEFAFLCGFLITALVGILELGMIFLVSSLMEGGIRDATRYGTTGQGTSDTARAQKIVDIMNSDTLGFLNLTAANVTTKVYTSFGAIAPAEKYTDTNHNGKYDAGEPYVDANSNGHYDADPGVAGTGSAGQIVLYTVSYNWPLMFAALLPTLGNNGTITLTASHAIKNEPYAPI